MEATELFQQNGLPVLRWRDLSHALCFMTTDNNTDVIDNVEQHRFELVLNGVRAELVYARTPHALVLVHTEVPPELRGGGVGAKLVEFGVAEARRQGLKLVVRCPFARAYLERHPPSGVVRDE